MRAWIIITLLMVWAGHVVAGDVQAQIPKPYLQVRMQLAERTYPQIMLTSADSFPGPILYPEYMDFAGVAEVYGPPEFLKAMEAKLRDVERDPAAMKHFLLVQLVRYEGEKSFYITEAAKEIKVRMGGENRRGPDGFEWDFSIPSSSIKWEPGTYRFELGMWYEENGAHKTVGEVIYFEVRKVEKGSGDEINLLTNALMQKIPGVSQKLITDKDYVQDTLAERILALDPNDVLARHSLIREAEGNADFDTSVKLWEEIRKLVADGKAHRPESLVISPQYFIREPLTKEEYEGFLNLAITNGLQRAQTAQKQSAEAKETVADLVRDGKFQEVTDLIAAVNTADGVWPAFWAIRAVKEAKTKNAHETLVQELGKLPHIPAMFQREIVDALAAIHDDTVHGNLASHTSVEGIAIIEWWLAHPKLEDIQSENSEKDATPPADTEPASPAEGGTSPPTEGTPPPPGSGNP